MAGDGGAGADGKNGVAGASHIDPESLQLPTDLASMLRLAELVG